VSDDFPDTRADASQVTQWRILREQMTWMPSIVESMRRLNGLADRLEIAEWRDLQEQLTTIPAIIDSMRRVDELANTLRVAEWRNIQKRLNTMPPIIESMTRLKRLSTDLHKVEPDCIKRLRRPSLVDVSAYLAGKVFREIGHGELKAALDGLSDVPPREAESVFVQAADALEHIRAFIASLEVVFMNLGLYSATQSPVFDVTTPPTQAVRVVRATVARRPLVQSNPESFRIVGTRLVPVRLTQNGRSQVIGILVAGHVVQLVEKKSRQCMIRWYDDKNGNAVQGWARSKCLRRIRSMDCLTM
jgi:hypothetical protein